MPKKSAPPHPYPPEFRARLIDLVRAGESPESLAKRFEPTAQSIRNWIRQADLDAGKRRDGFDDRGAHRAGRAAPREPYAARRAGDTEKSRGLVCAGDAVDPDQAFGFVSAHRTEYRITTMCRLLEVSASGYYAWEQREPSAREQANDQLLARIRAIHVMSRETYGAPRMIEELVADQVHVGHNRVARLMRKAGLVGASRRKGCWTTRRDKDARPAPDLVERKFVADAPNKLWVADITYIPTWTGFLFLAVVLDVFSRRIVGWSMANHLRTELIIEALNMAIHRRRPQDVIHHSDQGCQYTSIEFGRRCREEGVRPSMGSVGDCFDNAMCESFFATLECELLAKHKFHSQGQAMPIVFEFIEGWYNPQRRHSSIGYLSPMTFEKRHAAGADEESPKNGFPGCPQIHDHVSA